MTHEQSLAYSAINASKCLGFSWGQDVGSEVAKNLAAGPDIQSIEILSATAGTATPKMVLILRDIPANTKLISHYASDYLKMSGTDAVTLLPVTDIKHNEILGYPKLAVFDELQKLRADETRFRAVLRDLRSLTAVREQETIVKRLEALLEDFQDDYGRCLDTESLRTFVALLSLYPELRRPVITAAENGNLFAEWKTEDGKRFLGLQLLPMHQVRFVAFRPDTKYSQLRNHSSGITSVDQLFTDLASYDILAWARVA